MKRTDSHRKLLSQCELFLNAEMANEIYRLIRNVVRIGEMLLPQYAVLAEELVQK